MNFRRCPVCRQLVGKTRWGGIALHLDSIERDTCPGSRESWDIAAEIPVVRAS